MVLGYKFNEIQVARGMTERAQVLPDLTTVVRPVVNDMEDHVPERAGSVAGARPAVEHLASRLFGAEGFDIGLQALIFLFPILAQPAQVRELDFGQAVDGELTFLAAQAPVPLRIERV